MSSDKLSLPLLPLSSSYRADWESQYKEVLEDEYICKKYNRKNRIQDKVDYINKHLPEVKAGAKGLIIDLGCGPGEFLEICRFYGNTVVGVDARLDDCEMGAEYIKLSYLLCKRQNLDVKYIGFENMLKKGRLPFEDNSVKIINSQGSIEQIFKDYLIGEPHINNKSSKKLIWKVDDSLDSVFYHFFKEVKRILKLNGVLVIYANGTNNKRQYDMLIRRTSLKAGLELVYADGRKFHKLNNVTNSL